MSAEEKTVKILTLVALLVLSLYILWPYVSALLFAVIVTYLFLPVQKRLTKVTSRNMSAGIVVISVLVTLSVIIARGTFILIRELRKFYKVLPDLTVPIEGIHDFEIAGFPVVAEATDLILSRALQYLTDLSFRIPGLVFSGLIFFGSLFYLLREGEELYEYIKERLPFREDQRNRILQKIKKNVDAFIYAEFTIAFLQGIAGGIIFYLLGHPYPVLMATIIGVLALIPVVGPSLIYWPVGIYGLLVGNYVLGIGSIVAGIVVISSMDYFLRPKITGDRASIHPFIVLLGFLGGIYAFGPAGIIIGPVVLSISIIVIDEIRSEKL